MALDNFTAQQKEYLIEALLFIESNLSQVLSVDIIAEISHWSRWQLQRLFVEHTGMTIAQYIRQRRLAKCAEKLLSSQDKQIDIALSNGFESEISFSRCFKQHFNCPPRQYRKRGLLTHIRLPLHTTNFHPIRIEQHEEFQLQGHFCQIQGILSPQANFKEKIPQHWQAYLQRYPNHKNDIDSLIAAIVPKKSINAQPCFEFDYWLGYNTSKAHGLKIESSQSDESSQLTVPKQSYAVITHRSKIAQFEKTVHWLLTHWLPDSGYCASFGTELEVYPQSDEEVKRQSAEYWLAIKTPDLIR